MPNTSKRNNLLIDLVVDYPKWVLAILIIVAAALGWQARRFEINASAETLLTQDNEIYLRTQQANRLFAPQEFLLIAYRPTGHETLSQTTFDDIRSLTEDLKTLSRVESVRSILNVPLLSLAEGGLRGGLDPNDWTIENNDFSQERIKKALTGHPIYQNLLVNENFTATALQVTFESDPELERLQSDILDLQLRRADGELSDAERAQLESLKKQADPIEKELDRERAKEIEAIRSFAEKYEDRADVYLGGAQALAYELIKIVKSDLVVFGIAIFSIICVALAAIFRSFKWVAIPVLCCVFSVLPTMGILAMLGLKATVISANFIALQLILTIAISLHLVVQFIETRKLLPDADRPELLKETLRQKAGPCFYAGLTTSVGFASLLFSGLQPVIAFGYMMIIAMAVSILSSLVLFPAALSLFGQSQQSSQGRLTHRVMEKVAGFVSRQGGAIAIATLLLVGAGVVGLFRLDVENSFLNYFRESTQTRKELAYIDQEFGGSTPLDIIYDLPNYQQDPDLILSADTAQTLQRIQNTLKEKKGVGKALSLVNFTELAVHLNNGRPLTEYELTAIYRTLDEDFRESLVGSFFSPEQEQARISLRISDTTEGLNRATLMQEIRDSMAALDVPTSDYELTSLFVLYQDILQRLFRSQILTVGLVLIALSLTFWAIFRSLRIAAIAIVPNIVSTVAVLGIMGLTDTPLDLMTITIAAIAMGIAVDNTIHYTHRFLDESEEESADQAIVNTHGSVGHAILYTSIVIILGFSALSFSDFVPSILFGLLTAFSIAVALLSDLLLLPVLLRRFLPRRRKAVSKIGTGARAAAR